MIEWFDSHCHVNEERFDDDRDAVLAGMREHGVTRFAVIGSDMESSRQAISFAGSHPEAVRAEFIPTRRNNFAQRIWMKLPGGTGIRKSPLSER